MNKIERKALIREVALKRGMKVMIAFTRTLFPTEWDRTDELRAMGCKDCGEGKLNEVEPNQHELQ